MKANGSMIKDMAKALNGTQMATATLGNSSDLKLTAMEFIHGPMGKCMMGRGKLASNRDMVSGADCKMILTSVSGVNQRRMDMVFTLGLMVTATKVNGICA